jgi:hypothetical protein
MAERTRPLFDALKRPTLQYHVTAKREALRRAKAKRSGGDNGAEVERINAESERVLEPLRAAGQALVDQAYACVSETRAAVPPFSTSRWWTFLACAFRLALPRDLRMLLYQHYVRAQYGQHVATRVAAVGNLLAAPSNPWLGPAPTFPDRRFGLPCVDNKCDRRSTVAGFWSKLCYERFLETHFAQEHGGVSWSTYCESHATCQHLDDGRYDEVRESSSKCSKCGALLQVASFWW